jgi:hypothetical protein
VASQAPLYNTVASMQQAGVLVRPDSKQHRVALMSVSDLVVSEYAKIPPCPFRQETEHQPLSQ